MKIFKMENIKDKSELLYLNKGKKCIILCVAGYTYYRLRKYLDESIVWRCSSKSSGKFDCVGSITVKNEVITKFKNHSPHCKPDEGKIEVRKEISECKNKLASTSSHKSIPQMYNKTVVSIMNKGIDLVSKVPKYTSLKSSLYNARNQGEGMPKFCFENPSEVIVPPKYSSFLLGDFNFNGERILIFCAQDIKCKVGSIKHIFGDGTFKSCPRPFKQIYSVHYDAGSSETESNVLPFVYALMSSMSKNSYVTLFQIIKSQLPDFSPSKFTCDFEEASRTAIAHVFHGIEIKGCYYHYSNSLWRKAKKLNLTKPSYINKIIALTSVLPLLPSQYIKEGWSYILSNIDFIKQQPIAHKTELNNFVSYYENFWLKSDDFITSWSIFQERHRTNNNLEGWNFKLNNTLKSKNVNILQLLKVLFEDAELASFKRRKIDKQETLRIRKTQYIINDSIIMDKQMQLLNGIITIPLFLESLRSSF